MRFAGEKRSFGVLLLALATTSIEARAGDGNGRLAATRDGKRLVVVNQDNGSISLVDLKRRRVEAEIPVGKTPEGVALAVDDTLAVVALWAEDAAAVVDLIAEKVVGRIETADEPYGVVASKDGKKVYLTHTYPGLVVEIDPAAKTISRRFEVGDSPKGLALANDGEHLLIAHYYTGAVSFLNLKTGAIDERLVGAKADNLARNVAVHPKLPYAYVPHIRSRVERARATGSIFPFVDVIDLDGSKEKRRTPIAMDNFNGITPVADPWEVSVSPDGRRLYAIYGGTDDMNVIDIVPTGYPYFRPVGGLVSLGSQPRGVTVGPDGKELYVLNALDFNVWVFQTDPFRKVAEIQVSENPLPADVLEGKKLFHSARPPMSSRRWISCASCHPGGDQDGRTWQNPEGKRNTTALFGLSRTGPLHWSADRDEAHDFEYTIRGPLMQGPGLVEGEVEEDPLGRPLAGRSKKLDALARFCNALEPDLSPHALAPGKLSEAASRGRLLFESAEVGCATCHPAPDYTDSSLAGRPFRLHDVGTGEGDPSEKMGKAFDTPTLLGVYRTPPYLHDGRANTLRDVLVSQNKDDRHGRTSRLNPRQIDDLVEFVKSLPYQPVEPAR